MKTKRLIMLSFITLTVLAFVICFMYSGTLAIWNLTHNAKEAITITYGSCMIMAWMCIVLESASKTK